ncbi:MAG: hypothetical protein DHS20C12_16320 [Pseudohongiella sp.]|nr:MAG: hypothetical protein DHS20C12_16320 [Pseudohongiella sp.]
MSTNTPIYPHGKIEEIAEDLFMLRGSIKMNPLVRITRNMGIVRSGDELCLINPVRVNAKVEAELEKLGKIKHVMRLGCFHGVDDPYYVEKFGAQMWAQSGGTTYTEPKIDKELDSIAPLPFDNGEIFEFAGTKQPECALLIDRGRGTLFTCDAIQNYGDYSYNNIAAKILMPFIGFPRTTLVGPIWLKFQTPEDESLESEFRRLLGLRFDRLLAAHGTLLESGAHAAVEKAIEKAFEKEN